MNGASRRRRARIPEGIGARQTSPLGGIFLKIRESDSDISVALTKRYDTLTKMLDATKGYAKHEAERLAEIVKLCKGMSMGERGEAKRRMDELAGRINVLAEAYPGLKASENFRQLQFSIVEVEEHLQAVRRIYNMNVSQFNRLLVSWPSSMVGSIHRHIRCMLVVYGTEKGGAAARNSDVLIQAGGQTRFIRQIIPFYGWRHGGTSWKPAGAIPNIGGDLLNVNSRGGGRVVAS